MKSKNTFLSLATFVLMLFASCNSDAQNTNQAKSAKQTTAKIEIIQFHSENRCMTCNKIEELSKETLKNYPTIQFSLVNVDDPKNEKKSEEFEAYGTSLFLYDTSTGKKKNLTEFAFMNAGNKEKFIEGLKMAIEEFGN